MQNTIFYIISISKQINEWNEKLNAFAEKYMDNPWFGTIIVFALFAFCCLGINSFGSKK